jgi:serine/threonine protein kinase
MAERSARKEPVTGEVLAGKFRLERLIGSGGMGSVWRAWNLQLEIPVALKVMAANIAEQPGVVERFEREAKAAAQIRGRHVVNIYEHGVHEGLPYMVMELLEGEDLNQRLRRERRLSLPATARVVGDLCKALGRAHELGIIHRDLKPANVFLARDGDDEVVKVLDFGVAKLTQGGDGGLVTATGQIMGTPIYMSPEHIQASKHVDPRADLWSLGVIAFRALAGQLPFRGSIFQVTTEILSGPVPVPSSVAPDLPPAVDAFFARALARDIDRRFQTARELSDAFGELLAGAPEPSAARPAPGPASSPDGDAPVTLSEMRTVAMLPKQPPPRPLRHRSWITWVVIASVIAVTVATLLAVALWSRTPVG